MTTASEEHHGRHEVPDQQAVEVPETDDSPAAPEEVEPDRVEPDQVEPDPDEVEPDPVGPDQVEPDEMDNAPDDQPHLAAAETPILRARGISLAVAGRPVFADVDVDVVARSLVAVVGPAGSGRSSLLLALSGRMAVDAGTVTVAGSHNPKLIRNATAVARIGGLAEVEGRLTVAEAVVERALLDGVRVAAGQQAVRRAAETLGLNLDDDRLVEELSARDRTLLAVALACARPADVIVLDDLDAELPYDDQAEIAVALQVLAATGPAVVVSTTDRLPLPDTVATVDLHHVEDPR